MVPRMRSSQFLANKFPIKHPNILGFFFLTYNSLFHIFNSPKSEFLVRQAKLGESSWLRSQPDKVSRLSEPSFVFMWVTVLVMER